MSATTTAAPAKRVTAKKRPPAKRGGPTVSEKIRKRLLAGEVLRASDVAKQYNATSTILSSVMATMRKSGAKFTQIERGVWQMAGSAKTTARKAKRKAPARRRTTTQRRPATAAIPAALPETGQVYECFLSMIDDNGDTVIGFRNGADTWFVRPIEAEVLIPA